MKLIIFLSIILCYNALSQNIIIKEDNPISNYYSNTSFYINSQFLQQTNNLLSTHSKHILSLGGKHYWDYNQILFGGDLSYYSVLDGELKMVSGIVLLPFLGLKLINNKNGKHLLYIYVSSGPELTILGEDGYKGIKETKGTYLSWHKYKTGIVWRNNGIAFDFSASYFSSLANYTYNFGVNIFIP